MFCKYQTNNLIYHHHCEMQKILPSERYQRLTCPLPAVQFRVGGSTGKARENLYSVGSQVVYFFHPVKETWRRVKAAWDLFFNSLLKVTEHSCRPADIGATLASPDKIPWLHRGKVTRKDGALEMARSHELSAQITLGPWLVFSLRASSFNHAGAIPSPMPTPCFSFPSREFIYVCSLSPNTSAQSQEPMSLTSFCQCSSGGIFFMIFSVASRTVDMSRTKNM